jgi:hypothetical protein
MPISKGLESSAFCAGQGDGIGDPERWARGFFADFSHIAPAML